MRFFACGVLVALAACTSPNPKSCLDGSCTDPRYPFCDENGVIADEPKTCIAVSCTAGETAECRGDVAVTCNAGGDNYDLVQCPQGCDSSGCTAAPACTTNTDCVTATAPICDPASDTCHACATHDDCESSICNQDGSCEPVSNVVFASPSGETGGDCPKSAPCTLARAATVVANAPTKVMRMLPGTYTEALKFMQPTSSTVRVVAAGAILGPASQFAVSGGARVHVEELDSRSTSSSPNYCNGGQTVSTLELERSRLLGVGSGVTLLISKCIVALDRVDIEANSGYSLDLTSSTVIADRIHLHGTALFWAMHGTAQRLQVTNSLLENVNLIADGLDQAPSVSTFLWAFNTFVYPGNGQFACPDLTDGNKVIRVENNIIVGLGTQTTAVYRPQNCVQSVDHAMNRLDHNVIFPFTATAGTNVVADPKFVNAATQDFHIQSTSPAHDAAVPSADLTTSHDYSGAPRTGTFDIGAYELP